MGSIQLPPRLLVCRHFSELSQAIGVRAAQEVIAQGTHTAQHWQPQDMRQESEKLTEPWSGCEKDEIIFEKMGKTGHHLGTLGGM